MQVGRSGVPVLLVAATETVATEHGRAALERFRAHVPAAEVEIVDSGHDVLADALDATAEHVGGWLRARRDPQ